MATTTRPTRPALDLTAPTKRRFTKRVSTDATAGGAAVAGTGTARPGLALVLALLAISASTLLWKVDEPLPGFLVGGSLGIGAFILASRARRIQLTNTQHVMAIAATAITTLAFGQMLIWTAINLAL